MVKHGRMIAEVKGMPGTQQIDREWLQLKKFLFHNLQRKCEKVAILMSSQG